MTQLTLRFASVRFLLVGLLLLSASGAGAQEELQQALEQAQQLVQEGKPEEAVMAYSEILRRTNGASGPAYLGRAFAKKEMGDLLAAQEDIKNAQVYSGGDPQVTALGQNLSAEIFIEQGAWGDALEAAQAATEAAPKNAVFQFNLGKVLSTVGAPTEAVAALSKWLDAGSDDGEKNAEAYRLRGRSYASLGKYDDAASDISAALELEPENHETYLLRGLLMGIQEKWLDAADAYEAALKHYQPEEGSELPLIEAHLQRAVCLEEAAKLLADDPAQAEQLYQEELAETNRLIEALPDRNELLASKAQALFRKGVAERMLGNLTEAVTAFSEATNISPSFGQAFFRRGICYFHLGEERLAIDDFRQAAGIEYGSPHAALWMGRTYAQLGEYYEAIRAYGQALAVSDRYWDAYINRGLTYLQLGEFERAISDFNDAIRLQPTNAQSYYFRGVAFGLLNQHQRAIKSLDRAIQLDDQYGLAYLRLADQLSAIGQSGLAAQYRSRGMQLSGQVSR